MVKLNSHRTEIDNTQLPLNTQIHSLKEKKKQFNILNLYYKDF